MTIARFDKVCESDVNNFPCVEIESPLITRYRIYRQKTWANHSNPDECNLQRDLTAFKAHEISFAASLEMAAAKPRRDLAKIYFGMMKLGEANAEKRLLHYLKESTYVFTQLKLLCLSNPEVLPVVARCIDLLISTAIKTPSLLPNNALYMGNLIHFALALKRIDFLEFLALNKNVTATAILQFQLNVLIDPKGAEWMFQRAVSNELIRKILHRNLDRWVESSQDIIRVSAIRDDNFVPWMQFMYNRVDHRHDNYQFLVSLSQASMALA